MAGPARTERVKLNVSKLGFWGKFLSNDRDTAKERINFVLSGTLGAMTDALAHPLYVGTNVATAPSGTTDIAYQGLRKYFRAKVAQEGARVLMKGYSPVFLLGVPGNACFIYGMRFGYRSAENHKWAMPLVGPLSQAAATPFWAISAMISESMQIHGGGALKATTKIFNKESILNGLRGAGSHYVSFSLCHGLAMPTAEHIRTKVKQEKGVTELHPVTNFFITGAAYVPASIVTHPLYAAKLRVQMSATKDPNFPDKNAYQVLKRTYQEGTWLSLMRGVHLRTPWLALKMASFLTSLTYFTAKAEAKLDGLQESDVSISFRGPSTG